MFYVINYLSNCLLSIGAYYYQQFKKTLASAFLIARKQALPLLCFMRTLLLAGIADLTDTKSVETAIQGESVYSPQDMYQQINVYHLPTHHLPRYVICCEITHLKIS
jgi:hypothetical protein